MKLVNKYIEEGDKEYPTKKIESDGPYFRRVVKRVKMNLNNTRYVFDKIRYFDKEKVYIKTLNIFVLNDKRLEDDDFYVSFSGETEYLIDELKYRFGLFSKKDIPESPRLKLIELRGKETKAYASKGGNIFFYHYSKDFLQKNPDNLYQGINISPLDNMKYPCLAAFIIKSPNKNVLLYEVQTTYNLNNLESITIPKLSFQQSKEIKEDGEIIWG